MSPYQHVGGIFRFTNNLFFYYKLIIFVILCSMNVNCMFLLAIELMQLETDSCIVELTGTLHKVSVTFVLVVGRWLSHLSRCSRTSLRGCQQALRRRAHSPSAGVTVRGHYST